MKLPPEDLPRRMREELEAPLRPFFSSEFVLCSEWFERFTTETAARDLTSLRLAPEFETPCTALEALTRHGYTGRARIALTWMLEKLADDGFFDVDRGTDPVQYRRRVPLPTADSGSREKALALAPACAPAFAVVDELSHHIEEFFAGQKTGEEILFSPAQLKLWFDYFNNDNLLYAVNNHLGAEAVIRTLPVTHSAVILELGAGSGSAATALLERLEREGKLARVAKYNFTEPVPTFLRRGERALRARWPSLAIEARKLDMNLPFAEQGFAPATCDLVYAVNTLHVARNLHFTLTEIFSTLRPGGRLVLSECIRPRPGQPIYVEYIFNFLNNFVDVITDETRPTHGFLTPANWRAALARAGFDHIEELPSVEKMAVHFPSFFVGAISARKPA